MTQYNLEYWLKLNGLLQSVIEGTQYLINHRDNRTIKEDLILSVGKVNESLNMQTSPVSLSLFKALESYIQPKALKLTGEEWLKDVYMRLCRNILQAVKEHPQQAEHLSAELFDHLEHIPVKNAEYYALYLEVSLLNAAAQPDRAFHSIITMLEHAPELLSNQQNVHPGYVYRQYEQHTFERCPICGGKGLPYFTGFSYLMANFSAPFLPVKLWMKCDVCKNLYTWKFPKEFLQLSASSRMIYPDKNARTVLPVSGAELSGWCEILTALASSSINPRLLEVGIGSGGLLAVAQELGFEVDAVELVYDTAKNVADTLEIPVWNGDFLQYTAEKKYSVITMGDVLEHVTDPTMAMKKARSLLDDEGILWLSTPNYESSFSKMRKFKDPMWMEPMHITYFNYAGLKKLAEDCGFEIKNYKVSARYNGSMELMLRPKI